jgi:hypothetical protein
MSSNEKTSSTASLLCNASGQSAIRWYDVPDASWQSFCQSQNQAVFTVVIVQEIFGCSTNVETAIPVNCLDTDAISKTVAGGDRNIVFRLAIPAYHPCQKLQSRFA